MHYRIKPGYSFLDADSKIKTGGDTIDLSDDAAAAHAEKIEPCAAELLIDSTSTDTDSAYANEA